MPSSHIRYAAAALVAGAGLTLALMPAAQSQIRANPSFQAVGVSASGTTSTAWFHDPSTGRAIACQTTAGGAGGPSGINCVATKLPQEGS
ncbi:hypothetical protein [Pseudorhodoferax sp. Leaf267]|uniref:hypothetical protein n=1 Tax=Pseudorhodoferax sp. Leaf267 TaxID=1736316 RepID=UPI0012E1E75E|nr:hypothetical protein [Pseudorhodoferax sp. Leaf267]